MMMITIIHDSEKPTTEGYYGYYKSAGAEPTIVYLEFRPDSAELYAFAIGFIGGTPISTMDGKWSEEITITKIPE